MWNSLAATALDWYAQAAQEGAPQAQQIADRFHILMNLREAVEQELSRQRETLVVSPVAVDDQLPDGPSLPVPLQSIAGSERSQHDRAILLDRRKAKQVLFETIHRLYRSGKNVTAIARETGIGRKRVDKMVSTCGTAGAQ